MAPIDCFSLRIYSISNNPELNGIRGYAIFDMVNLERFAF